MGAIVHALTFSNKCKEKIRVDLVNSEEHICAFHSQIEMDISNVNVEVEGMPLEGS